MFMERNQSRTTWLVPFFAPAIVFLFNAVADFGFGVYAVFPWFDIPMHTLGGAAIGVLFLESYRILREENRVAPLPLWVAVVCGIGIVVLFAVLWEFFEFGVDTFFRTRMQPGVADTMLDLCLGMLGGGITVWWGYWRFFRCPSE